MKKMSDIEFTRSKKKAFTLAEILITIALIGVVAAVSISLVFNNYQKILFEAKLKKTFSSLQTAISLSIAQNGYPTSWNHGLPNWSDIYSGDKYIKNADDLERFLNTYLFSYMKFMDKGSNRGQFFASNYVDREGKNISSPINNNCLYYVKTQDGVSIAFMTGYYGNLINNGPAIRLIGAIDLNGPKGPNILGTDFYNEMIIIDAKKGTLIPNHSNCNRDNTCISKKYYISDIMSHGWKIRY